MEKEGRKRAKIGLALGGGGARGLAHLGVLKVLEREKIALDLIVGTSMGALIGAAYAVDPDAEGLERRLLAFFEPQGTRVGSLKLLEKLNRRGMERPDLLHRLKRVAEKELALGLILVKKSLLSEKELGRIFRALLPEIDLRDTKIPFFAAAVDLISGREVTLKFGPLIPAVMASCAVPGFMPPVRWDGKVLVDGGIVEPVPCRPAKEEGAEIVIGVDVGPCICRPRPVEDGIDEIQRVIDIMGFRMNERSTECADVIIEPAVKEIDWTDFSRYKKLIREGEEAAQREMDHIKRKVNSAFPPRLFPRARGFWGELKRGRFWAKLCPPCKERGVSENSLSV